MEINKRIIALIEILGLTPSEFADKINVQRSGISHITSGRNKPSLDFLESTLLCFPEINSEWLILGKGKPLKSQNIENKESHGSISALPTEEQSSPLLFPLEEELNKEEQKIEYLTTQKESDTNISTLTNNNKEERLNVKSEEREVKEIIVLYTDNTFDIYKNKKG